MGSFAERVKLHPCRTKGLSLRKRYWRTQPSSCEFWPTNRRIFHFLRALPHHYRATPIQPRACMHVSICRPMIMSKNMFMSGTRRGCIRQNATALSSSSLRHGRSTRAQKSADARSENITITSNVNANMRNAYFIASLHHAADTKLKVAHGLKSSTWSANRSLTDQGDG
jgi:hypothetical protein